MSARLRASVRAGAFLLLGAIAFGAIFGVSQAPALDMCVYCALKGAVTALLIGTPIVAFELFVVGGKLGGRLLRLPFTVLIGIRTVIYLAFIATGLVVVRALIETAEESIWHWLLSDLIVAFLFALAFNFIMQMRRMLGAGVLAKFVVGRCHRPWEEERVFLFLDLVGSTRIAETIGNVRFHELLNRISYDLAGPIIDHGGEFYRYVGDQVIVT